MKIKCLSFLYFILLYFATFSQQEGYKIQLDLSTVKNDRLPVQIYLPDLDKDSVEYHLAKIVPGTYSISNFGRFVKKFRAYDAKGGELITKKLDVNRWQIQNAKSLYKITYEVEDTFDPHEGYTTHGNVIFEPGGMELNNQKNVYAMNPFAFIGYLNGYKFIPYELTIQHDESLYGATSLKRIDKLPNKDVFVAANFNFLADAPIMYCVPDTVSKNFSETDILISVYSPNNKLNANHVMDNIDELMEAQAKYLGGKLPVDRYVYLIYLLDKWSMSGSMGALEHSYSSFYTLPEPESKLIESIGQTIRDVAAHEFFHIVTPLNLHSEQIHNFDYINPKMSQHLWLYEGYTEYTAHHVQLKYDFYTLEEFLNVIRQKIKDQEINNVDIPYTRFSKNILLKENQDKYADVYSGGALIAMCVDLKIIESTNGEKNLRKVVAELSQKYGPFKPFRDEELFSEIEKITNEEVGRFLRKYIGGANRIPYEDLFDIVGIVYSAESEKTTSIPSFGGINVSFAEEGGNMLMIEASELDDFGKKMGFETGDLLLKWNKKEIEASSMGKVLQEYVSTVKEGDELEVEIKRRNKKGKYKKIKLKEKVMFNEIKNTHSLELRENLSDKQKRFLNSWMNP